MNLLDIKDALMSIKKKIYIYIYKSNHSLYTEKIYIEIWRESVLKEQKNPETNTNPNDYQCGNRSESQDYHLGQWIM